jgi:hypothetical protein
VNREIEDLVLSVFSVCSCLFLFVRVFRGFPNDGKSPDKFNRKGRKERKAGSQISNRG